MNCAIEIGARRPKILEFSGPSPFQLLGALIVVDETRSGFLYDTFLG